MQVRYAANLDLGESFIYITNDGANGAPLYGPGFAFGGPGNICVNVYAVAPDEQLVSCCSCLVTPNGLVRLAVKRDLLTNTVTGAVPTSAAVKLVSTLAGSGGTSPTCGNSAGAASSATRAKGLLAWGTTAHRLPSGAAFVSETPFSPATLGAEELASLSGRCAAILGNGSGSGICRPCSGSDGNCGVWAGCPNLTDLAVGVPGSLSIPRSGASAYTCTLTAGALPPGLSLNGCSIEGTPTSLSSYDFTIAVADASSPLCVSPITCSKFASPLDPACVSFCAAPGSTITPANTVATGGTPPYSFSAAGLPASLGISAATGVISGTVTAPAGSYLYNVTVRDSSLPQQTVVTETCTVTVSPVATASCPVLQSRRGPPMIGSPINFVQVPISGGTPPYTCSATGLPAGLVMTPFCSIGGTVPLTDSCVDTTFRYTIAVRDASLCPTPVTLNCSVMMICDP